MKLVIRIEIEAADAASYWTNRHGETSDLTIGEMIQSAVRYDAAAYRRLAPETAASDLEAFLEKHPITNPDQS